MYARARVMSILRAGPATPLKSLPPPIRKFA
jgi:hypothetical protein